MLLVSNIFFLQRLIIQALVKKKLNIYVYIFFLREYVYRYDIINIFKIKQYEFIHLFFIF